MKDSYGNQGENNCTFKVTYGAGFKLRSDAGHAPAIIIQPVPQQQVQHLQPKLPLSPAFPVRQVFLQPQVS